MSAETATPAAAAPPVQLTSSEKRALREKARRDVLQAERERIAAARAAGEPAPSSSPPPGPAAAPAPAAPGRTDADRENDAAAFLSGVLFPMLAFVAGLLRFIPWRLDLEQFSDEQALSDAKVWVPVARRYLLVDRLITSVGVPARIIKRLRQLAVRKGAKAAPPAAPVQLVRGDGA